MAIVLLEEQLI